MHQKWSLLSLNFFEIKFKFFLILSVLKSLRSPIITEAPTVILRAHQLSSLMVAVTLKVAIIITHNSFQNQHATTPHQ